MSILIIVIPVLMILMFTLGLELVAEDFKRCLRRSKSVAVGLLGQMVVLPLAAFMIASWLDLSPVFAVGLVLIACAPGGAASNAFTMLAGGDIALSVSLTAISSFATVLTIPFIVSQALTRFGGMDGHAVHLPLVKILMQNVVVVILPIVVGMVLRARQPELGAAIHWVARKISLPLLLIMVMVFIIDKIDIIKVYWTTIGWAIILLMLSTMTFGELMGRLAGLERLERIAIVIETGMQNAGQAIAIAVSPFLLNNDAYAIPATIYAVIMNVVLLSYIKWVRFRTKRCAAVAVTAAGGQV